MLEVSGRLWQAKSSIMFTVHGMTCARRQAGARRPASSTHSPIPAGSSRPDPQTGRRCARLSLLVPVLALLLGALGLFAAVPAQAQVTVWSATLTTHDLGNSVSGCSNAGQAGSDWYCTRTATLSDDDFVHDGATYTVRGIYTGSGDVTLRFTSTLPAQFVAGASLKAGTLTLALADATFNSSVGYRWSPDTPVNWSVGSTVSLSLVLAQGTQSSNANLSALTATSSTSASGTYTDLDFGTFAKGTTSYTVTVAADVSHVKLTPTVEDTGKATVKVGKGTSLTTVTSGSASGAIALGAAGTSTALKVEVTPESGAGDKKTYTVTVTRAGTGTAATTPTATLDVATEVLEGQSIVVTVRVSPAAMGAGTVTVSVDGPEDYELTVPPVPVVIGAGTTAEIAEFPVNQDTVVAAQTYAVSLSSDDVALGMPSTATVTTLEDDFPLTVTPGNGALTVSWTAPSWTVSDYDVHYTASTTVAAGAAVGTNVATGWVDAGHTGTTASQTLSSLTNDTAYRVRVRAKRTVDTTTQEGNWNAGSGTPVAPLTLTLSTDATDNTVTEGRGFTPTTDVTVTATLNRAADADGVTVTLDPSGTATRQTGATAATGDDYRLSSTTIEIEAGATTGTATLTVIDEFLVERPETVVLNATSDTPSLTASPITLTIRDNDDATVSFSPLTYTVNEGASTIVTVVLDKPVDAAVTVTLRSGPEPVPPDPDPGDPVPPDPPDATEGTDYTSVDGATVTFVAGETSELLTISALADAADDDGETFAVSIQTVTAVDDLSVIGGPDPAVVTITDVAQSGTSSNANLFGLTATSSTSASGTYTSLNIGTFDSATTDYTASVANSVTHVKLTPTKVHADASIKVGKRGTTLATVANGATSAAIALAEGANALDVEVTPESGASNKKTYTVTVTRAVSQVLVSLHARQSVDEGDAVGVEVRLSPKQDRLTPLSIPVTVTRTTSEEGDHSSLSHIDIHPHGDGQGLSTGVTSIYTYRDGDTDDETFTVALGSPLPSGLKLVPDPNRSSVTITIKDDGATSDPPVVSTETETQTPTIADNGAPADLTPSFGGATVADQSYTAGTAIDALALPRATGGDGTLRYRLTPAPPSGLTLAADARTLSGTPSGAQGSRRYTWTATDADGDTDTLSFAIAVAENPHRALVRNAVKRALSAVARRAMSSALDNIGARFADIGASGLTLAGQSVPLEGETALEPFLEAAARSRSMTGDERFRASAFSLHYGTAEDAVNGGVPLWSVWGRGDLGTFAGGGTADLRYDGDLRTGWLGVDARAGSWVAGLAVSYGEGEADYGFAEGQGRLEIEMTALYPYGRWTLANGMELRAVVGAGTGDARHEPQDGEAETGDLSMRMASLGMRQALPDLAGVALALRGDASVTRIETDDGPDMIQNLSADSWRLRAGLEASRRFALEGETALEPFLEAAARQDGGDGLEGSGVELAGGLRYIAPGVAVELRGRWLATHSEDHAQEQGVSLTVRAGPGAHGRGLFFALNPRWGAATDSAQALWNETMPDPSGSGNDGALDAQLGYGFFLAQAGGVLTPFAEAGLTGGDHQRLQLGVRFEALHADVHVELAGEHSAPAAAKPEHTLRLDMRLRF